MRRARVIGAAGLAVGLAAGCHHTEYDTSVPRVEEFATAPAGERYDRPPEQAYRKPAPKKEFKPGLGPSGPAGGGMGGGGGGP